MSGVLFRRKAPYQALSSSDNDRGGANKAFGCDGRAPWSHKVTKKTDGQYVNDILKV